MDEMTTCLDLKHPFTNCLSAGNVEDKSTEGSPEVQT